MNRAISSTNVVLNMAINPSLLLIPSNLIILKDPIPGFNNELRIAMDNMKFSINENLNKVSHTGKPKDFHIDKVKPLKETKVIPQKERKVDFHTDKVKQ